MLDSPRITRHVVETHAPLNAVKKIIRPAPTTSCVQEGYQLGRVETSAGVETWRSSPSDFAHVSVQQGASVLVLGAKAGYIQSLLAQ
eukprot:gene3907-4280_t